MQNCYLHYNINIINHKSTALWCHMLCWKTIPTIWQNMIAKILIFKLFNELGKIWKCDLGFSKIQIFLSLMNQEKLGSIHCPRPTFQNPNFKSWMNWEKWCPNLSITVENKMGNSHKKVWSHFKLTKMIEIHKILRIYPWIGKNGMNPLGILPIPPNIWPKGLEDISSLCIISL